MRDREDFSFEMYLGLLWCLAAATFFLGVKSYHNKTEMEPSLLNSISKKSDVAAAVEQILT